MKPKIGLLPLYLKLYDEAFPKLKNELAQFLKKITNKLEKEGYDVIECDICCVESEFEAAVGKIEKNDADAIVTLHLSYSPSLESSKALAETKLPIIVLDTTEEYCFDGNTQEEKILYNHGIHGVQDMCNLLIRNKKPFAIVAGHFEHSDIFERLKVCIRGACIASSIRKARVGMVGEAFRGMGDFFISQDLLKETIGIITIKYDFNWAEKEIKKIPEELVEKEMAIDFERFDVQNLKEDIYINTERVNQVIRQWIREQKLSAFTINFTVAGSNPGFPLMTFLEASKAMAEGIGYAGEGDVLTAALVGAVLSVFKDASFTEMFCPDWQNESVFLSHMGEMNINLTENKPVLTEKIFDYGDAPNPAVVYGRFKPGKACFLCLAPAGESQYNLILAPGQMLDIKDNDSMKSSIRGWFKPDLKLSAFLEAYSKAGGIHHAVLVYGDVLEELSYCAEFMNWNLKVIK